MEHRNRATQRQRQRLPSSPLYPIRRAARASSRRTTARERQAGSWCLSFLWADVATRRCRPEAPRCEAPRWFGSAAGGGRLLGSSDGPHHGHGHDPRPTPAMTRRTGPSDWLPRDLEAGPDVKSNTSNCARRNALTPFSSAYAAIRPPPPIRQPHPTIYGTLLRLMVSTTTALIVGQLDLARRAQRSSRSIHESSCSRIPSSTQGARRRPDSCAASNSWKW